MPLTMTLGGGLGLMSISVIVAELVMLHCTKEKKLYQKMKTDKLDAIGDESVEGENEEIPESNNIPKFPTMLPELSETIALKSNITESRDKEKKSKINGFIEKV